MLSRVMVSGCVTTAKGDSFIGPSGARMRNRVRERLGALAKSTAAKVLGSASENLTLRKVFFRSLFRSGVLLVSRRGGENFLVDSNDTLIGEKIFVQGTFDLDKLATAF